MNALILSAVLLSPGADLGSPVPGCVCGDGCKCATGECPSKCPVKSAPVATYTQVCGPNGCRLVPSVSQYAASSGPTPATGTCSNGSCGSTARTGWYPGKLIGRRR